MYFIDNKGITDPRINLAIEEYVLKNMDIEKDDFFCFILISLYYYWKKPKYN